MGLGVLEIRERFQDSSQQPGKGGEVVACCQSMLRFYPQTLRCRVALLDKVLPSVAYHRDVTPRILGQTKMQIGEESLGIVL